MNRIKPIEWLSMKIAPKVRISGGAACFKGPDLLLCHQFSCGAIYPFIGSWHSTYKAFIHRWSIHHLSPVFWAHISAPDKDYKDPYKTKFPDYPKSLPELDWQLISTAPKQHEELEDRGPTILLWNVCSLGFGAIAHWCHERERWESQWLDIQEYTPSHWTKITIPEQEASSDD